MTGWDNMETFKDITEAMDFVNDELKFNWLFEYVFEMNSNETVTVYWNDR